MSVYVDFPYGIGPRGRTATTDYADHVRDLIEQLLFTRPGERVNRPDFGCGLQDRVFEPNSGQIAAVLQATAQAELQRWLGDLIAVDSLVITAQDSTVQVQLQYRLIATGQAQSTVIEAGVR